jgi:phospholipid N-methyltransferase
MEDKTNHFDINSQIYNNVRPGYPNEIYDIISTYKNFDINSNILEIGAGNGIASQEIYNQWNSKLTLIEPGNNFYGLLYNKFKNINNIKIENITFEQYRNEILFDAIFSATSFHWLDLATKYKKSYDLLKKNGILVLYWNNYEIQNNDLADKIQKIYGKYSKEFTDKESNYERIIKKIENRKNEIEESRYFKLIEHKIIYNVLEYTKDEYIQLLKTFPDHSELVNDFWIEMEHILKENGDKISVIVIINLEIADKIQIGR